MIAIGGGYLGALVKAIIGKFEKQAWVGKDTLTVVKIEEFDATDVVIGMNLDQIRALEDCEQGTDSLGRLYVEHDGPFAVYVTDAICEFFSVMHLDEITAELLRNARQEWEKLPQKRYMVTIQRVAYSGAEPWVHARSESEARCAALEFAGDIDFSRREHHVEYFVTAITLEN